MVQNVLRQIGGVGVYGVISVVLFFTVFGVAMVWALSHRKAFVDSMSTLPLEDDGGLAVRKGDTSHE